MPCGKDTLVVNKKPFDQKRIAKFSKDILKATLFVFAQVDIKVSDEFYDNFSEIAPMFVFQEITDCNIPEVMKTHKEKHWQKNSEGNKKLLGAMKAKKTLVQRFITWLNTNQVGR